MVRAWAAWLDVPAAFVDVRDAPPDVTDAPAVPFPRHLPDECRYLYRTHDRSILARRPAQKALPGGDVPALGVREAIMRRC